MANPAQKNCSARTFGRRAPGYEKAGRKQTSLYPYENRNALTDVVRSTTPKAQLG